MAEGLNVRLSGKLQDFVKQRSNPDLGLFGSASEYIRDLIRHDYEREEARKWEALQAELRAGMTADESQFVAISAEGVIAEARRRRDQRG